MATVTADLTRPDRGEALERLTAMTRELGEQGETYLLLCMSILAANAPDVATFIMDRADAKLDELADAAGVPS